MHLYIYKAENVKIQLFDSFYICYICVCTPIHTEYVSKVYSIYTLFHVSLLMYIYLYSANMHWNAGVGRVLNQLGGSRKRTFQKGSNGQLPHFLMQYTNIWKLSNDLVNVIFCK